MYKEIEGNIIELAKSGKYDCVVHGCNCFNNQGAGLAPQMAAAFDTDRFPMELKGKGDINKLGQIDYVHVIQQADLNYSSITFQGETETYFTVRNTLTVINLYSQYHFGHQYGIPVDYDAIRLGLRKINAIFKQKSILLPLIGCGLAGGDWCVVKEIILQELRDMKVTVVHYKKD